MNSDVVRFCLGLSGICVWGYQVQLFVLSLPKENLTANKNETSSRIFSNRTLKFGITEKEKVSHS